MSNCDDSTGIARGSVLHRGRVGRAVVRRDDRRDRLRHRGAVLHDRGGRGRRHVARGRRGPARVRRGPVAAPHARRARRVPPRAGRAARTERDDVLAQLWPRESGVALQDRRSTRAGSASGALDVVRRAGRHVPVRGGVRADRAAASSACSCASRSASSARSSRGTRRSRSSATRSVPRSSPAARSCSSRRRRRRARATCSPRSPSRSACRRACSTSSPPTARCRSCSSATRGVDKITFTGSTAAGRRIASLCGERIARCTLELGGKSAAVILDDMDLGDRGEDARAGRVRAQRPGVLVAHARSS